MAKTKFVRVAVSGPTIDGRNIDATQLTQAAKNYNPQTYGARINLEHLRGFSGLPPFQMYGDVLALKAEPIKLDVAGKLEDRVALFAQLDVSDDLITLNKAGAGQKVYTSIELLPDFAKTGEAYCVGIAATDSPASLGTERLQFTANAKALGNLVSSPDELKLVAEDPSPAQAAQTEAVSAFSAMKEFFANLGKTAPAAPAAPAPAPAASPSATPDLAAFGAQIMTGFEKLSVAIEASNKTNAEATAKVAADLDALTRKLETQPASSFTARPTATGGTGEVLADC